MVVTLGALLADVPHSRPVSITGLASERSLVDRLGFQHTSYEGPTGHRRRAAQHVREGGHPVGEPVGVGACTTWRRRRTRRWRWRWCGRSRGSPAWCVDAGELESAAEDYERQVSAPLWPPTPRFGRSWSGSRPRWTRSAADTPDEEDIPSADTIARDFQRFLGSAGRTRGRAPAVSASAEINIDPAYAVEYWFRRGLARLAGGLAAAQR